MSFRQIKDTARAKLHEAMQLVAFRYAGGSPAATPTTVRLRLHIRRVLAGDMQGTSLSYAQVLDEDPLVIALRSEFIPVRGDVLVFEGGEAYHVEAVEPTDGITVAATVVRLRDEDAADYTAPEAA